MRVRPEPSEQQKRPGGFPLNDKANLLTECLRREINRPIQADLRRLLETGGQNCAAQRIPRAIQLQIPIASY
jgi:hypothetical protein